MFDIQGFGRSKAEKLLGQKRNLNKVLVYFLKWYFSYNKNGYKEMLQNVTITNERVVI